MTCPRSPRQLTTEQSNSSHSGVSTGLAGRQTQAPTLLCPALASSELHRLHPQNWVKTTAAGKADDEQIGLRPKETNQLTRSFLLLAFKNLPSSG